MLKSSNGGPKSVRRFHRGFEQQRSNRPGSNSLAPSPLLSLAFSVRLVCKPAPASWKQNDEGGKGSTRGKQRQREGEMGLGATRKQSFPLSFVLDRPRRCPPFLLLFCSLLLPVILPPPPLLLLGLFLRSFFCTRHQRRRATSTRSAISRRRRNRAPSPSFSRVLRATHRESSAGALSRIPSKHARDSSRGLHYERKSW